MCVFVVCRLCTRLEQESLLWLAWTFWDAFHMRFLLMGKRIFQYVLMRRVKQHLFSMTNSEHWLIVSIQNYLVPNLSSLTVLSSETVTFNYQVYKQFSLLIYSQNHSYNKSSYLIYLSVVFDIFDICLCFVYFWPKGCLQLVLYNMLM